MMGFSTGQMIAHVLLFGIIGATIFGIRALRHADAMILAGMALLDVENEEPLS